MNLPDRRLDRSSVACVTFEPGAVIRSEDHAPSRLLSPKSPKPIYPAEI
jgi:hypothetical protein